MYRLYPLLLAALTLGTGLAQAQSPPANSIVPDVCRSASQEALPALETRKQRLDRDIQRLESAKKPAQDKALRTSQEELLQVTFQIECVRAQLELQQSPPVAKRAPTRPQTDVIEVTTYYATNRNQTDSNEPTKVYGVKFDSTLHFGRAVVTIPANHTPGSIELPRLWKLQREPDPSKHFVLKSVVPLDGKDARREMAEKLDGMGDRKALLVFVHGYNMGFTEAAMRTAQLAHDLKFAGLPFLYSWPSASQLLSYWQDEETAQLSEGVFEKLLDDLSQLSATDIYIVAHSMGNRVVSQALRTRVDTGKPTKHIREVLLAAPDINADLFRTVLAPKLVAMQGTRTTIYASSSDLALKASKVVHGFRRLGETNDGVFTYEGLETIDASTATQANKAYGHFYLMDNKLVLKDVRTIIELKGSAMQRGLNAVGQLPNVFWRLN
jgi:esterase/lipase superfamily enzyme